jgi:membrane-associated phospholipid phosphatase
MDAARRPAAALDLPYGQRPGRRPAGGGGPAHSPCRAAHGELGGLELAQGRPAAPARILVDLGTVQFAIPILLAIAGYVAFRRRSPRPLLTAVTGIVLVLATVVPAKIAIGRPNPGHPRLGPGELLGAFPSGHTTTACVCYVLAALLLTPDPGRRARRIALSTAAALWALVGAAMIWCGLHWFTDVIAGFALAGLIVPLTMWLTCRRQGARWPGWSPPDESRTLAASAGRRGPGG